MTAPRSYTGRVLVAVAIAALAFLLWRLLDVVIVAFGAIVVAAVLRTLAAPLRNRLHMPPRLALMSVVLLLVTLTALGIWLAGDRIVEQLAALRETLPRALENAMRWLRLNPIGSTLIEIWENAKTAGGSAALSSVTKIAATTLGAITSALLIGFAGVYLAADPALYRRGIAHLLPPRQRARVDAALQAAGTALSHWLLGQGVSMLAVGMLTTIGLAAIGMPLALTLGVITGLLAFVPFFGAITAGVLVVLLAFTQSPQMALHAALLFVALQQAEEFLIVPFVQRWAVRLPPALGLLAVLMFGLLFGPLGALLATPLMVVVMTLVQRLYVHDVVESSVAMPADDPAGRLRTP